MEKKTKESVLGNTTQTVFENCAKKLFQNIIDIKEIEPRKSAKLVVKGKNHSELLENYLNELIILSKNKGMVYSQFRVKIKEEVINSEKILVLEGVVFGEKPKNKNTKTIKISEVEFYKEKNKENASFFIE